MQVKFSWRMLVLAVVIALHGFALMWLSRNAVPAPREDDSAMRIEFIDAPIVIQPPPVKPVVPAKTPTRHPVRTPSAQPIAAQALQMVEPAAPSPTTTPQSLYGPDGRLRLPADLLDQIDRQFGDKRQFDFQVPGLNDGAKVFDRPTALAYEPTRFAQYYKPDQDLLTELLTKAVEKTTPEIRIPIPGNPKSKIVCRISLLALGGACGVETNGYGYTGPKDDPNTLNPVENRQCQAWWDKIIGAKTQDEWRATRKIYEQECRKPLERRPEQLPDSDRSAKK